MFNNPLPRLGPVHPQEISEAYAMCQYASSLYKQANNTVALSFIAF